MSGEAGGPLATLKVSTWGAEHRGPGIFREGTPSPPALPPKGAWRNYHPTGLVGDSQGLSGMEGEAFGGLDSLYKRFLSNMENCAVCWTSTIFNHNREQT